MMVKRATVERSLPCYKWGQESLLTTEPQEFPASLSQAGALLPAKAAYPHGAIFRNWYSEGVSAIPFVPHPPVGSVEVWLLTPSYRGVVEPLEPVRRIIEP